MFIPNHLHLIVKGNFKNPPTEVDVLNKWFINLVEKVRMVVVAGPTSVYVHEEGNEGLTGTVTLATSHGSIHVWDNTNPAMFQFDLYIRLLVYLFLYLLYGMLSNLFHLL